MKCVSDFVREAKIQKNLDDQPKFLETMRKVVEGIYIIFNIYRSARKGKFIGRKSVGITLSSCVILVVFRNNNNIVVEIMVIKQYIALEISELFYCFTNTVHLLLREQVRLHVLRLLLAPNPLLVQNGALHYPCSHQLREPRTLHNSNCNLSFLRSTTCTVVFYFNSAGFDLYQDQSEYGVANFIGILLTLHAPDFFKISVIDTTVVTANGVSTVPYSLPYQSQEH